MNIKTRLPAGLYTFIAAIIALDIFYFYRLFTNPPIQQLQELNLTSTILWIDLLIVILSVLIIPYGIVKQKKYARNFAIIFLIWSIFWTTIMLYLGSQILTHYIMFVILMILLMYILMSEVKKYFYPTNAIIEYKEKKPFTIGGYTLYRREIKKKDGEYRTFYYFSKTPSKEGKPTSKPENYKVKVNPKTGVPYLKKDNS